MKIYNDFIKIILDYYDKQTYNNDILYNQNNFKKKTIVKISNDIINIYNTSDDLLHSGNYEILGFLDKKKYIWNWSWLIPSVSNDYTKLAIYLHNYGIKLDNSDTSEHYFIKPLLSNSRLIIKNDIEQDTNIAICSYLLRNKIKFIFPYEDKNIITYYLIL